MIPAKMERNINQMEHLVHGEYNIVNENKINSPYQMCFSFEIVCKKCIILDINFRLLYSTEFLVMTSIA